VRGTVAGVDEVGRGPLAGPVVAAAVVLGPGVRLDGLDDSKRLAPARREALAGLIRERALAWALGRAEVEEIDRWNILQASLLAMRRAVLALPQLPSRLLVDGNRCPEVPCAAQAVVGGDGKVAAISAASVLAKVARDAEMVGLHARHPGYGFEHNKGYATGEHLAGLRVLGPCAAHRRSFAPVREALTRALDLG